MVNGWKKQKTLKKNFDTNVGSWIKKTRSPTGEKSYYLRIHLHPIFENSKKKKVSYYQVQESLLGRKKQFYGSTHLGNFDKKSDAVTFAQNYMRKH